MKHILVVNPAAGKSNSVPAICAEADALRDKYDIELYETTGVGDATRFVRERTAALNGEAARFYACGGDGTLKEVVTGAVGAPENVSVSVYPSGSGNDFVKYYGGAEAFRSLSALFEGEERSLDLITDGKEYSINAANFGFDYAVCVTMERARRLPILGGKRAYYVGIAKSIFTAMKHRAVVVADGDVISDGTEKFLLCTLANGSHIGGSYHCAPRADNEDGELELCFVRKMSVFRFLRLIGYYKRGEHLDAPKLAKYIEYRRAKSITVTSDERGFGYGLDGELHPSEEFTLSVMPAAIRFAIPLAAQEYLATKRESAKETANV